MDIIFAGAVGCGLGIFVLLQRKKAATFIGESVRSSLGEQWGAPVAAGVVVVGVLMCAMSAAVVVFGVLKTAGAIG